MSDTYTRIGVVVAVILTVSLAAAISSIAVQSAKAVFGVGGGVDDIRGTKAPIATSGNNVYVTWWTNKSGDWEVMFKASMDDGKTFGPKINLSNSGGVVSDNAEIARSRK